MGTERQEIAKVNKANKAFLARLNDYLGPDWQLEKYQNRWVEHIRGVFKARRIKVFVYHRHYYYYTHIDFHGADCFVPIDNEIFKKNLKRCADEGNETLLALKQAFDKYELHQQLQADLSEKPEQQTRKAVKV